MRKTYVLMSKAHASHWLAYMEAHHTGQYSAISTCYDMTVKQWKGIVVWKAS